ncbi:hypothetical protein C2S52_006024 [Perilla frutescens var. hirtella]|nr:hypothetical protein C2S52_006024 [Perilla frutescens var. hirtella]
MEGGPGSLPETSSSSQTTATAGEAFGRSVRLPGVLDTIRDTLHAIGGDAALESFRSGCFGHFLDYRASEIQKKAIHGLMSREVRVSDRALEGQETWFQIHHSQLRFVIERLWGLPCTRARRSLQCGLGPVAPLGRVRAEGIRASDGALQCDPRSRPLAVSEPNTWFSSSFQALEAHDHEAFGGSVQGASDCQRCSGLREGCAHIVPIQDDLVPGSESSSGSMGAGTGGGCGEVEFISLGGVLLPGADAFHQHPPLQATGYRRERPRLRVVSFVPSPEELATPYFRSMQLQAGAQSVRFVLSRSTNKKKMLANATSCCSTSAEEVVPPSARGTRAVRTLQKGHHATSQLSSQALRDKQNPEEIPGLRPPTEDAPEQELIDTTIVPRVQEYVDRAIDRALAGLSSHARRSSTPEVRDHHSPEPSDSGAANRAPTPPLGRAPQPTIVQDGTSTSTPRHGGFSATYQLMHGIDDSNLHILYSRFRLQGLDAVIQLYFNSNHLQQSWFDELEDPRGPCRSMEDPSSSYPQCRGAYGDDDYRWWIPAQGLIHRIHGSDGRYQVPWKERDYAIVVCDVADEH